jgi:hypothetical protein
MTINRQDIHPVKLDGNITTSSNLDLANAGDSFSNNGDLLLNELNLLTSAEVVVPDFVVGRTTHAMHAWEILADGSLAKWSRGTANSVSGARTQMDATIVVVAVPLGVSVPNEPQPNGPPAPGTTQKKIKIKIGQQGSLPF